MSLFRNGLVVLVVLLTLGCSQVPDVPGTYSAKNGAATVHLTLGDDGKGVWSTEGEDVPLTWQVKKGEVWLHTKSGGVLPGRISEGGVIRLELPGVGELEFRQIR
ncbi:MAG: hypothetical protein KKE73_10595 [Proteobacteria bacterium]|nr:hypothetical protein [Pseudomonadota bacterium]